MEEVPREILDGIGIDLVRELCLALGSHFKSGDLLNSIQYEITEDQQILILMLPHWVYVEYGTPGTLHGVYSSVDGRAVSIPANPDRKMPVHFENGDFINYITGQVDYALAKHVQEYGTQPYPFVRPVMYHKLPKIVDRNVKNYIKQHRDDPDLMKKLIAFAQHPFMKSWKLAQKQFAKTAPGKELKKARRQYMQATKPFRVAKTEFNRVESFMNRPGAFVARKIRGQL